MEVGELPPFSLSNPNSDETAASLTFNASIILTTIIACLLLSFLVFLGPKAAEFLASKGKSARGNGSSHVDSHPTRSEINTNGPPASVNSRAYEKVHVLLLSWQGADPRFHKQLDELQNVFRDYYHYDVGASDVEDFLIPSDNSKNELDTKLSLFLRKDSSNSLLILYYGGHGNMSVDRRAIWKKFDKDGPQVPWHDLQTKFFERNSDILILIDCCGAASSKVPTGAKGMVEVIYASGFGGTTPIWGIHSFTASLISELKRAHDKGTTALDLYDNLSNTLRLYRPQDDGREKRADPHHVWLARPEPLRTISLRSLLSTAPLQLIQTTSQSPTHSLDTHESQFISSLHGLEHRLEILKWLDPVDQSRFHNGAVDAKEKGTDEWISKDELYSRWEHGREDRRASALVLYGSVGCGKTVLCASIASRLEDACSNREGARGRDLVAKFYFSFEATHQQDLESLVKSIIQQLSNAPEIFSELRSLYDKHNRTWPPRSPSVAALQEALINGLGNRCSDVVIPRNVFLIIDALDEIPKGSRRDLVINFLKDLAQSNIPYLHILASSRHKRDISLRLTAWTALHISKAEVQSDIRIYVNNVIDNNIDLSALPGVTKDLIRARLAKDQEGMFRWAKLQAESLKRLDPATSETVSAALSILPEDLNSTYLKILKEIHPSLQQRAINALSWLCLASRSLFIEEVVEVCAIMPDETPGFREDRCCRSQDIIETLKDLVNVDPPLDDSSPLSGTHVVTLSHFSVKEYLTGQEILNSTAYLYKVADMTNRFICDSCLVYLFHNNTLDKRQGVYPLRDYAWNQWAWHAAYENNGAARISEATRLFESCVYEDTDALGELRSLHLIGWLEGKTTETQNLLLKALKTPYFYEECGEEPTMAASSSSWEFPYPPLDGSDTRLVTLLPSEYDSPEIRCQLVPASLLEAGNEYDAVSYTWGGQHERASYIRLNGRAKAVTPKLASILRILRNTKKGSVRILWIDDICINMRDMAERNSQVSLMAQIYQQAKEVAVVLEDETSTIAHALLVVEEISSLLLEDGGIRGRSMSGLQDLVGERSSTDLWTEVVGLFSQRWWSRIWPIQEIVLGARATIIYGKFSVNFDVLQRVMINEERARKIVQDLYQDRESDLPTFFSGFWWQRARVLGELRFMKQGTSQLELPQLLYASRYHEVSIAHDRIYAIVPLSLINLNKTPRRGVGNIPIDYRLSPNEVFLDCSEYILNSYGNLDILSYITHYHDNRHFDLPSWASTFSALFNDDACDIPSEKTSYNDVYERSPDPRFERQSLVKGAFQPMKGGELYLACGKAKSTNLVIEREERSYSATFRKLWLSSKESNQVLKVNGFVIDRVADRAWSEGYMTVREAASQRMKMFQDAAILKGAANESNIEIFWRTVVADQWNKGKRTTSGTTGLPRSLTEENELVRSEVAVSGLQLCTGRRLFRSFQGYLGLGPANIREGDFIVVLPGGKVPYVFRMVGSTSFRESRALSRDFVMPDSYLPKGKHALGNLRLIGESYVHGIMDGEVMEVAERDQLELQEIRIV